MREDRHTEGLELNWKAMGSQGRLLNKKGAGSYRYQHGPSEASVGKSWKGETGSPGTRKEMVVGCDHSGRGEHTCTVMEEIFEMGGPLRK